MRNTEVLSVNSERKRQSLYIAITFGKFLYTKGKKNKKEQKSWKEINSMKAFAVVDYTFSHEVLPP